MWATKTTLDARCINFKDNFQQEKVNKTTSKAKVLNICTLGPN